MVGVVIITVTTALAHSDIMKGSSRIIVRDKCLKTTAMTGIGAQIGMVEMSLIVETTLHKWVLYFFIAKCILYDG